jgi:hypothetical protein
MNLNDITLGVVSKDRYERLLPLLRSVSNFKPFNVLIIDNSLNLMSRETVLRELTKLGLALKLLEKLGFSVEYQVRPFMTSMFQLRQCLLAECKTKYLWIVDDDIEFVGNPLQAYLDFPYKHFGYLQGSKVDNRNTEGYKDYGLFVDRLVKASGDIPCWYYFYDNHYVADTCVLDCGNAVLNVEHAHEVFGFSHPTEQDTKDMTGEDILMGARLASKYSCFFLSNSKVLHFPKDRMRFKTKDPKWIWPVIEKECSKIVVKRLHDFYASKFDWSETHDKG